MATRVQTLEPPTVEDRRLRLELMPVGGEFAQAVARGDATEIACFGARGDRKTWSFLIGTILHGQTHQSHGFALPVKWASMMDYFASHKAKTHETLKQDRWQGLWHLSDGGHIAHAMVNSQALVELRMFGLEDIGAIDRARMETHCVWGEEAAPAASLVTSAGFSESAWATAVTSMRLGTHAHVAALTLNYPEETHWTWRRFVTKDRPGDDQLNTLYFRIPVGEGASPQQREEWARSLANRPDLLRRLIAGQPGQLLLGDPVTPRYSESLHRKYQEYPIAPGPVRLSWDGWHHPACTVASLSNTGQLRIHMGRRLDNSDVGEMAREVVIPWLTQHGVLDREIIHTGDPTMETADQSDRHESAVGVITTLIPGRWITVTNEEEPRIRTINTHLGRVLSTGEAAVVVAGPDAAEVHAALSGGWHYGRTGKPVNTGEEGQHSHVGNAVAYLALAVYGQHGKGLDMGRWANQSAYTQPWNGSRTPTPSPAVVAMQERPRGTFDPEKWRGQYK
jgi:hypothetical protein